jgi:hypothetical protein
MWTMREGKVGEERTMWMMSEGKVGEERAMWTMRAGKIDNEREWLVVAVERSREMREVVSGVLFVAAVKRGVGAMHLTTE